MDDWWLKVCDSWSTEIVRSNEYTAGRWMEVMRRHRLCRTRPIQVGLSELDAKNKQAEDRPILRL